jgi:hypothetical protein
LLIESADGLEWKKKLPDEGSVSRANSSDRDELTVLERLNIKHVPPLRADADDIACANRKSASVFKIRCSRSLHPMLAVPLSIAANSFEARSDICAENATVTALVEGDSQTECQ